MFPFGKPSQTEFASQLIEVLKEHEPNTQFEFDAENFQLVRIGEEGSLNLANIYREHCSIPRRDQKANLSKLASIFRSNSHDLPEYFEDAKPHLRPKIYARSTIEFMNLEQRL
ncbi:MAG TPA: hypothetical protein PLY87_26760, partial [Planctomycetaceae bacterium]|nr:hypothetical protein [Planctomycetaceae bacterium]